MRFKTSRKCFTTIAGLLMLSALLISNAPVYAADGLHLASRILDKEVYDSRDKLIGEVEDLIIRRSGRVKKVIIEYGGFYDIADRLVAFPAKQFHVREDKAVVDATEEQLDKKPAFNYHEAGLRTAYYYYNTPPHPYPASSYYYEPSLQDRGGRQRHVDLGKWAFSPGRMLASVVMNRRLVNEQGKDLGWVDDLLVDLEKGEVTRIVVSSPYLLGEDQPVTVPYRSLGFTGYGLVYDITAAQLKDMPLYESSP